MRVPLFAWRPVVMPIPMTVLLLAALAAQDAGIAPFSGENWRVRLLAPLSTGFNRKGDMVSAQVLEPAAFQGAILEGVVHELKAGGDPARASSILIEFVTLHAGDKALPVSAALVEARNSRREPGVDDAGAALETGGPGIGGKLIGVFSHGASTNLRLTARSAHLSFAPGSEFVLRLQLRKASNAR
ncbi:MAG: hypothetical protein P4K98_07960 [Bryobacteraceae bacterium]|nr:hypothetical protein [Bryobacteraceae bacterium]